MSFKNKSVMMETSKNIVKKTKGILKSRKVFSAKKMRVNAEFAIADEATERNKNK